MVYAADGIPAMADVPKWRASIHMPRWASRLTLRVTSVTEENGHACGAPSEFRCDAPTILCMGCRMLPRVSDAEAWLEGVADRAAYLRLWEQINGETYPARVWRIAFERVEVP